ncbi:MAG: NfeD family protein [Bacteroidetes bacterium]|nr:NfeD family protein [Bacteroidota bacterium]
MGWIIFLLLIGLLLILMELFLTPGLIVGVIGFLCWIGAIYQIYLLYGARAGNWTTAGMITLTILLIVWGLKTNIWNKVTVHESLTGRSNQNEGFIPEKGMKGIAISTLRPMGSARFGDSVIEVDSRGEMINQGEGIEIIAIEHGKIYVQTTDKI